MKVHFHEDMIRKLNFNPKTFIRNKNKINFNTIKSNKNKIKFSTKNNEVNSLNITLNSTLELNNGVKIPIIGFGTWMLSGNGAYKSVRWALESGYRLIDTATIYDNERKVGQALRDSGISRDEIFITTKVWNNDQGHDNTLTAFKKSLKRLDLSHVDLYLIHWPVTGLRNETWKALENIYEDGKARAIGVSNFTIRHLKELLGTTSNIPVVNQVEFSPFLFQKDLLEFCNSSKIIIEAYCPLTRARKLDHPLLKTIGKKHGKTPAQLLIRWGLQHGIVEIPKSAHKERILENANIFDFKLNDEDMNDLDNLNENFRVGDDPEIWE